MLGVACEGPKGVGTPAPHCLPLACPNFPPFVLPLVVNCQQRQLFLVLGEGGRFVTGQF